MLNYMNLKYELIKINMMKICKLYFKQFISNIILQYVDIMIFGR